MESSTHQEWRARQKVNWRAIVQATLGAGGVLFIMSGGSPWSTAGTMNAIMGRDLPLGFFPLLFLHLVTSFIYVAVIAHVIYRLRVFPGIMAGLATAMALYALNYAVFYALPIQMQSPEQRAFFVHFTFGLLASGIYKGASVPRPFRGGRDAVEAATHQTIPEQEVPAGDPEPQAVVREGK
jgi:hypothetical protein